MKKVRVFLILVWSILIVSCSPKITEGVIQTAIAQTQQSLPTLTPKPSDTKTQTRTLTNSPTITYTPTIEATSTVTLTPSITVTPTITPTLTKPPSPTATADMRLKLSLSEFVAKYDSQTDLAREEFVMNSIGKTVDWTGRVFDVDKDYSVVVDIPGTLLSVVSIKGIPPDDAKLITKGSKIRFKGEIDDIISFLGLRIYIINGQIIK